MHTQPELKEMAKVVLFNIGSQKSNALIMTLVAMYRIHPNVVINEITKLANS